MRSRLAEVVIMLRTCTMDVMEVKKVMEVREATSSFASLTFFTLPSRVTVYRSFFTGSASGPLLGDTQLEQVS